MTVYKTGQEPKMTVRTWADLDPDMARDIRDLAKDADTTIARYIRRLIRLHIEEQKRAGKLRRTARD